MDTESAGGAGNADRDDAVDAFLARARATPDHPAVVVEGESLSYAGLAGLARGFARAFAGFAEPRVLIALPAGAHAYAAMLGAGLAGGCYTPVNVDAPVLKLQRIARRLRPDIVIAGDAELAALLLAEAPAAVLLRPAEVLPQPDDGERGRRSATAYVMFTSGSTGEPKGVVIPRAALNHYIGWMRRSRMFNADDRVSQYTNIGFDISLTEIYGALCAGATLFPVQGKGDRLLPAEMIVREKITVWNSVPSLISLMMRAGSVTAENLASLRLLNFCGEPLLPQQLAAIFAACPHALVRNTYGPTEATVSMTSVEIDARNFQDLCRTSAALGAAIPGMGLHLVGGSHPGEGEIVITGPQLAAGYWEDPQRTAELFRPVTIDGRSVTGYFTGDWVERHGGQVFFKERIDFQVKVRGVRIELDEVAAAVRDAGWPVVCVLSGGDHLVAVVERHGDATLDERALAQALTLRLETQAIPRVMRLIEEMPRNENGKIDRRAVAAWLEAGRADRGCATKAPYHRSRSDAENPDPSPDRHL